MSHYTNGDIYLATYSTSTTASTNGTLYYPVDIRQEKVYGSPYLNDVVIYRQQEAMEWQCEYCGSANVVELHRHCEMCGAPRKPMR